MKRCAIFVRDKFTEEGLVSDDRKLKLHMTVLNAPFENPDAVDRDRYKRHSIDAVPILKKLNNIKLGTFRVGQIQIVDMEALDDSGAYHSEGAILLP